MGEREVPSWWEGEVEMNEQGVGRLKWSGVLEGSPIVLHFEV